MDRIPARRWSGRLVTAGVLIGLLAFVSSASTASASEPSAPTLSPRGAPTEEQATVTELLERYAPVLYLKQQREPCDRRGEGYRPLPVDAVLDKPDILLRQVGNDDPVIMRAPRASDLHELGPGIYLDFPGSALDPGCTYEIDGRRYGRDLPDTIYARVVTEPDRPGFLVLQYWTFWYFNDWNNIHEGDWEGIQVLFEVDTVEEALRSDPVSVGYAQHEGGERVSWTSSRLTLEDGRPVVFSSAGSHASYFDRAVYLGRSASEGFGCDDTTGPSERVDPQVAVLPSEISGPDDPFAWLTFEGRWGERQAGPFNGPTGPADKDRWDRPVSWHEQLRSSSVVVPAGDGDAARLVQGFCTAVEWGSMQLVAATLAPMRILVVLGAAVFIGWRLARRTRWARVADTPVIARRRAGELLPCAFRWYRRHPATFAGIGLLYLPVAGFVGLIVAALRSLPILGPLIELGGDRAGSSVVVALLLGGAAHLFGAQVVGVAVAHQLGQSDAGGPPALAAAMREIWSRRFAILVTVIQVLALVLVPMLLVVGVPIGIWLLVRYQFVAPAIALDGVDRAAARRRSSELVQGRWWHTAVVAGLISATLFVLSTAIGLLVLVSLSGLPLWAFALLVHLVAAALTPVAAIAMTLLYGDAVAERTGAPPANGLSDPEMAREREPVLGIR